MVIKSRMRWVEYVVHGGEKKSDKILVEKPKGKGQLRMTMHG
jgi:hypothetical protein